MDLNDFKFDYNGPNVVHGKFKNGKFYDADGNEITPSSVKYTGRDDDELNKKPSKHETGGESSNTSNSNHPQETTNKPNNKSDNQSQSDDGQESEQEQNQGQESQPQRQASPTPDMGNHPSNEDGQSDSEEESENEEGYGDESREESEDEAGEDSGNGQGEQQQGQRQASPSPDMGSPSSSGGSSGDSGEDEGDGDDEDGQGGQQNQQQNQNQKIRPYHGMRVRDSITQIIYVWDDEAEKFVLFDDSDMSVSKSSLNKLNKLRAVDNGKVGKEPWEFKDPSEWTEEESQKAAAKNTGSDVEIPF